MKRNLLLSLFADDLPSLSFQRARLQWNRMRRALKMEMWFPHIPLALAVGLAGLVQLLPYLGALRQLVSFFSVPAQELSGLRQGFGTLAIHGVPQELVGYMLILLAFGLVWRLRLAWVLTLLITAAALGLQFVPHATPKISILLFDSAIFFLIFVARGSFQRVSLATGTLYALVGVILTMGYGVIGCYLLGNEFTPRIKDFSSALYFTVVTMSTVGYGDVTPHTADARLFTISLIILGLVIFATALTAIGGPLINLHMMNLLQPRKKIMKRNNHIIVVGDSPLARNAIKSLTEREVQVTAIWNARPPEGTEAPRDLVIGDGGDVDVLRRAGVESARAVLALGEDDSNNAFVALAAKDANENVRTVVVVSDAHNMGRIRHVRPDAVLALPVIGGELLAMALSGEEMNTDALFEQLLQLAR